MSDRTVHLTVVLDHTYRVDDAEAIVSAIKMIKGVADVGVNVANPDNYIAYAKARIDLENIMYQAIRDAEKKNR